MQVSSSRLTQVCMSPFVRTMPAPLVQLARLAQSAAAMSPHALTAEVPLPEVVTLPQAVAARRNAIENLDRMLAAGVRRRRPPQGSRIRHLLVAHVLLERVVEDRLHEARVVQTLALVALDEEVVPSGADEVAGQGIEH